MSQGLLIMRCPQIQMLVSVASQTCTYPEPCDASFTVIYNLEAPLYSDEQIEK